MKKIFLLMAFFCLLGSGLAGATEIDVRTALVSTPSGQSAHICSWDLRIRTVIRNLSGSALGIDTVKTLIPAGITVNIAGAANPCGLQLFQDVSGAINYRFTALADGDSCVVEIPITIPCSIATPVTVYNSVSGALTISNTYPDTISFSIVKPVMQILNFKDKTGTTINNNSAQCEILALSSYRLFDLVVADGIIDSFTFFCVPEDEIVHTGYTAQAFHLGSPVSAPVAFTTDTFTFTPTLIQSMFGTDSMGFGDLIRIRENFSVVQCSQVIPDGTLFGVQWYCGNQASSCNSATETRTIKCEQSLQGVWVSSPSVWPRADLCGGTANHSNIAYTVTNNNNLVTECPGSSMKTVHSLVIPIDTSWFTYDDIILVNDLSTDTVHLASFPAGFFSFNGTGKRMILNFDTLAMDLFTSNSCVVDSFLEDGRHNEMIGGRSFTLYFINIAFHCKGNDGTKTVFGGCKAGSVSRFPFAEGYYDAAYRYQMMCSAPDTIKPAAYSWWGSGYPMDMLGEASAADVDIHDTATIDFYYNGAGNPFAIGAHAGDNWVFACDSVKYDALVRIPAEFLLSDSIRYSPYPNELFPPGIPSTLQYTDAGGNRFYRVHDVEASGILRVGIVYHSCLGDSVGGYDSVRVQFMAICDQCDSCAFTMKCTDVILFRHGCGECGDRAAGTSSFEFDRASMGWTDSLMNVVQSDTAAGIKPNRAYPCDTISITSEGALDTATSYSVSALYYQIHYSSPYNFQFFEFIDGYFEIYDSVAGPLTDTIQLTDLSPNWTSSTGSSHDLLLHIDSSLVDSLIYHKASIILHAKVKVRFYPSTDHVSQIFLPQIRGQYISVDNSGQPHPSCDDWGDNMTLLNVKTNWTESTGQVIMDDGYANTGYNFGSSHTLCTRRFTFGTQVVGGFDLLDDFPNEFRPITIWPDTIRLTVPSFATINTTYFKAAYRFPAWRPGSYIMDQDTLKLFGFSDGLNYGWPVLDHDGRQIDLRLSGTFDNTCAPDIYTPDTNVYVQFDYTGRAYTADPGCSDTHDTTYHAVYRYAVYGLTMRSLTDTFQVTSTVDTIDNIQIRFTDSTSNASYYSTNVLNAWVRPLPNPNVSVNSILKNNVPVSYLNGFYQLGTLNHATDYQIKAGIDLLTCIPDSTVVLKLLYGYSCSGYPASLSDTAHPLCRVDTLTIYIQPLQSSMALAVSTPNGTFVNLCDTLQYIVTLTSTNVADVEDLSLQVTMPSGVHLVEATAATTSVLYPGGPLTAVQSGDEYSFDLNGLIYSGNGMPPAVHVDTVYLSFVPGCNASGNQSINLLAFAENVCNDSLVIDNNDIDAPVSIGPNPFSDPLASVTVTPAFTSCTAPLSLTVNVSSITHSGNLGYTVSAILPPTFGYSGSTPAAGTPGNPTVWSTQSGTNATYTADYSIPANYCGMVPYTVTVSLADSNFCGGVDTCIYTHSYTITDSIYVCCSTCSLSVSGSVIHDSCNTGAGSIDITVSNGTAPYTYSWSNGAATQDLSGLAGGNYTVIVTDANGCRDTVQFTINTLSTPTIAISLNPGDVICEGSSVTLDALGCTGCTYHWTPGGSAAASITATPLAATCYTVTGTNSLGCVVSSTVCIKLKKCDDEGALCKYVLNKEHKDVGNAIELTPDKGYLVVGTLYNKSSNTDIYVVKYDQNFTKIFAKRIAVENGRIERGVSVYVDPKDNHYYVLGNVRVGNGNRDVTVTCLKSDGTVVWNRYYGGDNIDIGTKILPVSCGDKLNGLLVTGYTNSHSSGGDYDVLALKIDLSGTLTDVQHYRLGEQALERSNDAIRVADDEYILAGAYRGSNNLDMLALKIDANLNLVGNARVISNDRSEEAYGLTQIGDEIFMVGKTNSYGKGGYDVYLVDLKKSNLGLIDHKVYGTGDLNVNEVGLDIRVLHDKKLGISGNTENSQKIDALLMKVDPCSLGISWSRTTTNGYNESYQSFTEYPGTHDLALTGYWGIDYSDEELFISQTDEKGEGCCLDPYPMEAECGIKSDDPRLCASKLEFCAKDGYIEECYYEEKVICEGKPVSREEPGTGGMDSYMTIYPNPSGGSFTLRIGNVCAKPEVSVYDMGHRKVWGSSVVQVTNSEMQVVLPPVANGLYTVEVICGNTRWAGKIEVLRQE